MNRITVIIEREEPMRHGDSPINRRTEVTNQFPSPDFTLTEVLDVFEDALRGAGYHCPLDGLNVVDGDPK